MNHLTIADIERVPGTTKTWRTTRSTVIEGLYPGSGIVWPVPVGFPFEFSNPRLLWWLANPNDRRNAFYGCHHDVALEIAKDDAGRPIDPRLAALHAEGATAHLLSRRRRWLYTKAVVAVTHTFKPVLAPLRRLFHAGKALNDLS